MAGHAFRLPAGRRWPDHRYRDPQSGAFDPQRVLNFERRIWSWYRGCTAQRRDMEQQTAGSCSIKTPWLSFGRASRYDDPTSAYYLSTQAKSARRGKLHRPLARPARLPTGGAMERPIPRLVGKPAAPQPHKL